MTESEDEIEGMRSLRKQIRILSIVVFGLCLLVAALIAGELSKRSNSDSGWPDMSAGVLQAKRIVLMSKDGKPAAMLSSLDGPSGLALLDSKGEIRIFLTTQGNSGHITLSSEGVDQATSINNGSITMGDEKKGGIAIEVPPLGGPSFHVFDASGYSARLGRSLVANNLDGTVSITSAASLVGSSKDRASSWSLLSQPAVTSTQNPARQGVAAKGASTKQADKSQ
jgi:hypothetical protein